MADPKIAQARAAGYSEAEIVDFLASSGRPQVVQAREAGYSDQEILSFLDARPGEPSRPDGNPGIMAGLNDFKESVVAGAQRLRTMPENWGNIAEGIRGGAIEDYPVFGPLVAPVVRALSDPGAAIFGEPTADRADRRQATQWAEAGREGVARAYARQTPERQYERENDPWYTGQNLLHLGGEQLPQLAISGAGGLGAATLRGGAAGAMAMAGTEGLMAGAQINEGIVQELIGQGFSREQAVRAAALPSMGGGIGTSLIGRALGGFEADLLSGVVSRGAVRGLARGAASEGIEEGLQSGQEQISQNLGVRSLDLERGIFDNVRESALQGAVLGGLMGGGIGGVTGIGQQNEDARGRAGEQLQEDVDAAMYEGAEIGSRGEALRRARSAPPQTGATPAGSLTFDATPPTAILSMPLSTREAVDQVTWRERVAPVLDEMAQGNYDTLLLEQQDRLQAIEKAKASKKRRPQPLPDPIPPRPESQLRADPFTPEMGAELIRSAEAGPVTPSLLKDKGIPRPTDTLKVLERRGFLKQTGVQENTTTLKNGKTRTTKEPVYESTAAKPPEVARPGEASELYIKPVPVQEQATEGSAKGATPKAIQARFDAARARADDTRGRLAALPQIGEDWTQSRIDAMESRRAALETQLQQDEFELARAPTGRAAFAVVEKIAAPDGAPRENAVHTFPTRQEAQKWLDAKQGKELPSAKPAVNAGRNRRIQKALDATLKKLGLDDKVVLKIADEIGVMLDGDMVDPEGYAETAAVDEQGRAVKMLVAMARDVFDPALSDAELTARMVATLNHESIHAIRSLGLFSPQEWNVLARETRARKKDGKEYTYLQWAHETYRDTYLKDGKPDMDLIVEEAVAEMFKDWSASGGKIGARYTGLMNKVVQFFRKLFGQMRADGVLAKVGAGEIGTRGRQDDRVAGDRMYSGVSRRDMLAGLGAAGLTAASPARASAAPTAATLDEAAKGSDLNGLLTWVRDKSSNASYRDLAGKLLKSDVGPVDFKISLGFESSDEWGDWPNRHLGGDPGRDFGVTTIPKERGDTPQVILFRRKDPEMNGLTEQTLLHEAVHAFVLNRYHGGIGRITRDDRGAGEVTIPPFVKEWDRISDIIKKEFDAGAELGMAVESAYERPDEMLSYVLTNPEVQAWMRARDVDGKILSTGKPSMWDQFISWLQSLFGADRPGATLLSDIASKANDIIVKGALDRPWLERTSTALASREAADEAGPPGVPADRRFSFAGLKSKRPPRENYKLFTEMEKDGMDPSKIYLETGWYRGIDDNARYEISDADAYLNVDLRDLVRENARNGYVDYQKLGDVLSHPELFAAYPHLADINVLFKSLSATQSGSMSYSIEGGKYVPKTMTINMNSPEEQIVSIVLHEVQHAIQGHERWSSGASADVIKKIYQFTKDENIRRAVMRERARIRSAADSPISEDDFIFAVGYSGKLGPISDAIREKVSDFRSALSDPTIPDEYQKALNKELDHYAVHAVYTSFFGEIEARATEKRQSMGLAERRRIAPWRDFDVPEKRGVLITYQSYADLANKANAEADRIARKAVTKNFGSFFNSEGVPEPVAGEPLFSLARRKPKLDALGMVSPLGAAPIGGKGAAEMAARYTIVQDYLAKGARMSFGRLAEADAKDAIDKATTLAQDRMFPVRRMVSEVVKFGGRVTDTNDPVLADTLYTRRSQHRLDKAHENLYRPTYLAIQQIGATKTDLSKLAAISEAAMLELDSSHVHPSEALLNLYLYARHAPERNAFIEEVRRAKKIDEDTGQITDEMLDAGSGMTNEEAAAIMAWFAKSPKQSKVVAAAQKVDAILDYTRKTREASGLSPKWDEVDSPLVPKFKYYVPLRGFAVGNVVEDWFTGEEHARTGKAYKVGGKEDRSMKGRQTYAGDMLANVIMQNQESIVRSEKVRVGQSLARFVRDNPKLTKDYLVELPSIPMQRVVVDGKTRMSPKDVKGDPNYFVTKENGKDVVFEVKNASLGASLSKVQSFGGSLPDLILSRMARLTRVMSQLQTSYNPEFLVANFLRDVQAAMIQSGQYTPEAWDKIGKRAINYARLALADKVGRPNPELRAKMDRLSELGGLTGVYGLTSIEDQMRSITKELHDIDPLDKSAGAKALRVSTKAVGQGFKFLEDVNDAVEGATRLAVFEAFRELGWSEERSAQASKDMTVNFNRKGEWGPYMNAAYMFFNAATQGTATLLQASTSPRVQKVIVGIVIAGALQEILMSALSPEDEYGTSEYDKIEDYILEKNMIFMLGDGNYLKIPMPLGYNVFHSAGRNLARMFTGKSEPLEAAASMGSSVLSAFNPFGTNGNWVSAIFPSVVRPVVETVVNADFTGKPIHPTGMPGLQQPASQEAFPSVSEGSAAIAEGLSRATGGDGAYMPGALEVHPDDIDHMAAAYLGGMGRFLSRAGNLLGFAVDPQSKAVEGKELAVRDIPFYRSFAGNVSGASVRTSYDQLITPYLQFGKSFDQFEEEGNIGGMQAVMEREPERLMIYDFAADMERDRIKTRRSIREIQEDPLLDDASKVLIVKQLRDEEQVLMNLTIQQIRELERQTGQ